ncbi:MAG: hypothetical protein COA67_11160 [Lutibacter sp.]|nr:MAG: hypothetical protein COA67_11160 [Lutibacter sp.]
MVIVLKNQLRIVKKNIRQFIENITSLFSSKISDLLLAILLIPYLISKVGIENYGRYVFALSLTLFLVNIINYGFDLSAVRELAKNRHKPKMLKKLLNKVLSVKLYLTILMLVILFVVVFTIPLLRVEKTMYFFALFLIIGDLFSLRWFFMGIEKMKYIPIINVGSKLLYVFLVIIFIKQSEDYEIIILLEGIGLFIVNIFSFLYIVRKKRIRIKLISFYKVKCPVLK